MFFNRNIKYRDILIFALIGLIGYKLIDNYKIFFNFFDDLISIITPFIYALVFAYILNPVMKIFEKKIKLCGRYRQQNEGRNNKTKAYCGRCGRKED